MTDPIEGALAEFSSLRQEIDERRQLTANILIFQLTSVGAIFGFALSKPEASLLLLVIPFSSYLLLVRQALFTLGTRRASQYIREELSPRVPGGLNWESWQGTQEPMIRERLFLHPNILAFPAPSLLSLVWVTAYLIESSQGVVINLGISFIEIVAVVLIISQYRLALNIKSSRLIVWRGFTTS